MPQDWLQHLLAAWEPPPPTAQSLDRWQNLPTSTNIQDQRPGTPIGDALAKANLPLGPTWEEVYWPLRTQQLRDQSPTPEQQRYLGAHLPANLPTTQTRDPAWPTYVSQGSDETGHWRRHPDGQWFFVQGADYDYSKVPIPQGASIPGPLAVSDPADYW